MDVLREDNRAIIRAASQASKAADYILGFLPENQQTNDDKPSNEAAPSMAWDSIRFPAQSNTDIASVTWSRSAQAVRASTMARAPALEMTFCSRTIAWALEDAVDAHQVAVATPIHVTIASKLTSF